MGCSACSDTAVHEKTPKPHTEECEKKTGEQMEHDPEGRERLQVHRRSRDVEPEVEVGQSPVAKESDLDPAPLERQDVEMLVEAPAEAASVKRGSDAVADNEERARLRLRAEGKRGQKHDMQDVHETQAKTKARLEPRGSEAWKHATTPRSGGRGHVDSSYFDSNCHTAEFLHFDCSLNIRMSLSTVIMPRSLFTNDLSRDFPSMMSIGRRSWLHISGIVRHLRFFSC